MPVRALVRSVLALLVLLAAALAAVGGVSLGGSGMVAVALAAVVTGCLGAGIARDGDSPHPRQAAVDAAWRTAVGTVAVLLVLSGCAVLTGAAVTAVVAGVGLCSALAWWALRAVRSDRRPAGATVVPLTTAGGRPVESLSVEDLGREWLRTSAALAQVRGPLVRQALAERRREALDELERRDPAGFARWLAEGATVDSDPARYVSGDVSGDPAAGSDAA
ncbi:hypothetical protein FHX36_002473 [Modestobacter versicolor]|uniref:Uncharacterized protein n=1 Tax=Modestobacter versicolor TaxID=429133 RepID=A0A839Y0H9_9ACTN|nr:hypothetical protein [Modestobacter versicolor]MBB3676738.1 hypothetical protein [Modestobacter versicolor]